MSSRPLRISFVTETYPPEINGVSLSVERVVRGLARCGHRVQVVHPRQPRERRRAARYGVSELHVAGVPIPRYPELRLGLPARRRLKTEWMRESPDVVHVVTEGPLGWSAVHAARELNLPVTSDFRTNFHLYSRHYASGLIAPLVLAYLRRLHNATAASFVPTRRQQQLLKAAGFCNLDVIGRGVDTQLFHPARRSDELRRAWKAAADDPVVLHVGRLAPEKNPELLVEAFRAIRRRSSRARLVIVGDGPARAALERALPDAVFAGMRTGTELAAYYASGDLLLFPSTSETFGNVTLEAMASGLAVLAFDYAAAGEYIDHGYNGLTASTGDSGRYCELAASAVNVERLRALGTAARRSVEQLGWDRIVRRHETVFSRLAGESACSREEHGSAASCVASGF